MQRRFFHTDSTQYAGDDMILLRRIGKLTMKNWDRCNVENWNWRWKIEIVLFVIEAPNVSVTNDALVLLNRIVSGVNWFMLGNGLSELWDNNITFFFPVYHCKFNFRSWFLSLDRKLITLHSISKGPRTVEMSTPTLRLEIAQWLFGK
jgi:hypothetical protein